MQIQVIEFARHVLGLSDAQSTEFTHSSSAPVISLLAEQMDVTDLGGTMRLGAWPAMLDEGSQVAELYGTTVVSERHRHRYEFNARYREQFEAGGMRCSGNSPDGRLVEFVEIARARLLRRHAGPSRVQVTSGSAPPALPRSHQGRRRSRRGSRTAHHRSHDGRQHLVSDSFRVEGADVVFRSRVFNVEHRTIRHGGSTFERDVAVHPGAVAVVAVNDVGEVGFIRQYRATFDDYLLEIPAGTRDVVGESELATAQRELLEELGVVASEWTLLGHYMNSPGWSTQVMTVYEARGLTEGERAPAGPEEGSATIHWLAPEAMRDALSDEPAIDSTTAIALYRVFGDFLARS